MEDLIVDDYDHDYPNEHTLTVSEGDNYTLNGFTITPALDFTGTLMVPLQVSDGIESSEVYDAEITVRPALGSHSSPFTIYPNPSEDGVVYIEGVSANSAYSIRDVSGKLLQEGLINGSIELPSSQGIYLLSIHQGSSTYTIRVYRGE